MGTFGSGHMRNRKIGIAVGLMLFGLCCASFFIAPAHADTLTLKDGTTVQGSVIEQTR